MIVLNDRVTLLGQKREGISATTNHINIKYHINFFITIKITLHTYKVKQSKAENSKFLDERLQKSC